MKIARRMALLSGLCLSFPLLGAEEFEDGLVPIELVREFISGELRGGLPDGFPVPQMPSNSGLRVIGSLDRGEVNQVVQLHNSGSWEAARSTLRTAYTDTGWLDIGPPLSPANVPAASNRLSLCHDELGFLDFFRSGEDRIRVNRSAMPPSSRYGGALDCAQLKTLAVGSAGPSNLAFAIELMPDLALPDGATIGVPGLFGGISSASFGGSGWNFRADREGAAIVPESSVTALYEHFAAQIEAQGWELDSSSLGSASAASVWFKTGQTPEAPGSTMQALDLTGILIILQAEDDQYRVLFRLISTSDADGNGPPNFLPELGIRGISPGFPVNDPATGVGTIHSFSSGGFISGPPLFLP